MATRVQRQSKRKVEKAARAWQRDFARMRRRDFERGLTVHAVAGPHGGYDLVPADVARAVRIRQAQWRAWWRGLFVLAWVLACLLFTRCA